MWNAHTSEKILENLLDKWYVKGVVSGWWVWWASGLCDSERLHWGKERGNCRETVGRERETHTGRGTHLAHSRPFRRLGPRTAIRSIVREREAMWGRIGMKREREEESEKEEARGQTKMKIHEGKTDKPTTQRNASGIKEGGEERTKRCCCSSSSSSSRKQRNDWLMTEAINAHLAKMKICWASTYKRYIKSMLTIWYDLLCLSFC